MFSKRFLKHTHTLKDRNPLTISLRFFTINSNYVILLFVKKRKDLASLGCQAVF